ncbi:MAG: response regulator [Elusimicrobiota bacterium]
MKTIIMAEDEKSFVEVVYDELTEAGYKIFVAKTGKQCLDLIEVEVPDLIILDIKLPDMSGLKLLEVVRRKFTKVPIIMCTAYDSFKTEYEVWASKVSDYIIKPVDLDDLKDRIKKILGS